MTAVDTRNISRDSLFLLAELRLDGSETVERVKVRNLSAGGMMAEGPLKVLRGARLSIKLKNIEWVDGSVAWVQDNRFGIAFDTTVDPALARSPVSGQDEMTSPRFTRPAGYSAEDQARLRKI